MGQHSKKGTKLHKCGQNYKTESKITQMGQNWRGGTPFFFHLRATLRAERSGGVQTGFYWKYFRFLGGLRRRLYLALDRIGSFCAGLWNSADVEIGG